MVFDEVGYEAATTHMIAEGGNSDRFALPVFPDKAAIFNAMELRHAERVKAMWAQLDVSAIVKLPLRQMMHALASAVGDLFAQPVSRVVFVQFYVAREIFRSIDESMTQEAINVLASILKQRNPAISDARCSLLAEVCVHSSNAVMLAAFCKRDSQSRQALVEQIEVLMASYLEADMGDHLLNNVMKVMKCLRCRSNQLSKNGYRRGNSAIAVRTVEGSL